MNILEIPEWFINNSSGSAVLFSVGLIIAVLLILIFIRATTHVILSVIVAFSFYLSLAGYLPGWVAVVSLLLAAVEIANLIQSIFFKR